MRPETVRFASQPHPFHIQIERCADPDCSCADITFHLTEITGGAAPAAISCALRMDPETWRQIEAPQRRPEVAELVAEFLRDYPAAEREQHADWARRKKETRRRLQEYRFDTSTIKPGMTVPYSAVANEKGSIIDGGDSFGFQFRHEARRYIIEDTYCITPDCACRQVNLKFFEFKPAAAEDGKDLVAESFAATLSLDGKVRVSETFECTHEHATVIASAWWEKFAEELPALNWRYRKMKEIARRSMPVPALPRAGADAAAGPGNTGRVALDWRVVQALSPAAVPGRPERNDPCPCGSGRKFKRCCGVAGSVDKPVRSSRKSNPRSASGVR